MRDNQIGSIRREQETVEHKWSVGNFYLWHTIRHRSLSPNLRVPFLISWYEWARDDIVCLCTPFFVHGWRLITKKEPKLRSKARCRIASV